MTDATGEPTGSTDPFTRMKIDHIGIAVESVDEALKIYSDVLGFQVKGIHDMSDEGMRIAVIVSNGTVLELIEPLDEKSPVARFLQNRGCGVHHLCFSVTHFDQTVARIKSEGLKSVGEIRRGVKGVRVVFFHPKDTMGVLIEISEGDG